MDTRDTDHRGTTMLDRPILRRPSSMLAIALWFARLPNLAPGPGLLVMVLLVPVSPLLLAAPPELAPKTQQELTPAEVAALQAPLEEVAMRSWVNVPNDPTRPWHLSVIDTPEGLDVYVVKHQEDQENVVNRPERYLAMSMHSMGRRVFNLDAKRPALPVAGMTRVRQESQPLAGAEADGTVLSNPLADPDLIEYFLNPTGEVGEPGFYDDELASDPSLLFKLLAVNNLIEDPTVPGSFEGNSKPGRKIPSELLAKPGGYGKLTPEDFAVFYMLQRVMGARCVMDQPGPDFDGWPARLIFSRGKDGVDQFGRTEYIVTAWPVHPVTKRSDFGYAKASVRVGWDDTLELEVGAPMEVLEESVMNGVLGCDIYARPPPAGGTFVRNVASGYVVVGPATPSNAIEWDKTLPGGTALRRLIVGE